MKKLITIIGAITIAIVLVNFQCNDNIVDPPPEPPKPPGYQEDIPWPSLADSPWPMNHHDPQNSGRSSLVGSNNGNISNTLPAYNLMSGIVVGNNSTLYFTTSLPASLVSTDLSGNVKWEKSIAIESITTPLINNEGNIFVAGGQELLAFNDQGDLLWQFSLDGPVISAALNIDKEGSIYIIDRTKTLYAVTKSGELKWRVTDNRFYPGSVHKPAISPDGKTIYIQGYDVSLLAIDIDNANINWIFGVKYLLSGPVVDSQGNIYLLPGERGTPGTNPYYFYSLNSEGTVRWSIPIYSDYYGLFDQPAIDRFGNIYFGNDTLYSVSYAGQINWKSELNNTLINGSIICDLHNNVYFGTDSGYFVSLTQNGLIMWELFLGNVSFLSPVVVENALLAMPIYKDYVIYLVK